LGVLEGEMLRLTFQCGFKVQKSQIFMPHVQHSLVDGRQHTSQITTS
jgi:hypothetical protein